VWSAFHGEDEARDVVQWRVRATGLSNAPGRGAGGCQMRKRRGAGWTFRRGRAWYVGYFNDAGEKIRESTGCQKPPRVGKDGKEKPPTEVADFLRTRLNELDAGKWTHPAKSVSFDDLLSLVRVAWKGKGRSSTLTSKSGREQAGVRRLREAFGVSDARTITAPKLAKYASDRIDAGASISTVKNELGILRHAFKLALKDGLLTHRPAFPELRIPESTIRQGFFTRAQFDALLTALPEEMRNIAVFLWATGWRSKTEVLNRQWRHVDLVKGEIRLEPGETKNRKPRAFPFRIHPELSAAIDAQRAYTDRIQRETGQVIPWVFHRRGRHFGRAFWHQWKKACESVGLAGRIPHDFRRTAVRNLVQEAGVSERVAMRLTGHLTRSIFDRYHVVNDEDLKLAVGKLAAAPSLAPTAPDRSVLPLLDPKRAQVASGG
jgi:integrase